MANTYDTSAEPLGSTAPKVLYNNASNLDDAMNSQAHSWTDRPPFNRQRLTLWGAEQQWNQLMESSGFYFVGDYAAGLVISARNQYFIRDGIAYRIADSADLPYTLTGVWATDQPNFVAFDSSVTLSQDLASSDASKGVTLVYGAPRTVADLTQLRALPKTGTGVVFVKGFGRYDVDLSDTTSVDNGGTVVVGADGGRWKLNVLSTIDVKQFGAVCDGVVDDTESVQKWLNFLQTSGLVGVGAGVCKISATLVTVSPFAVRGSFGGFALRANFPTGDILAIGSIPGTFQGGAYLEGLEVSSSVTRTSGYNINLIGAYNTRLNMLLLRNGFNHIGVTGAASQSTHIDNIRSENAKNYHFSCLNVSADVTIDNWYCNGNGPGDQSAAGAFIRQAGDVTISRFNTAYCGSDIVVTPSSGERVQALHIIQSFLDTSTGYGIYAVPDGSGTIDLLSLSNNWIATHNQGGVLIGGGTGTVKQADVYHNQCCNNLLNGIFINVGVLRSNLGGNTCAANASNGIAVAPGVSNFNATDNTCQASGEFGDNAGWGMLIADGAGANHLIAHNRFQQTGNGGLYNGATGANRISWPNIGGSGSIKPLSIPSIDWGIDFTEAGAALQTVASGVSYIMAVGSGLICVADDATGDMGFFLCYAGTVQKIAGGASIVAGAAGANQIGVSFASGRYRVGNGFATSKNLVISSIKMRQAS